MHHACIVKENFPGSFAKLRLVRLLLLNTGEMKKLLQPFFPMCVCVFSLTYAAAAVFLSYIDDTMRSLSSGIPQRTKCACGNYIYHLSTAAEAK